MAKKKSAAASSSPKTPKPSKWRNYEEVARFLMTVFADEFGVEFFEGKQKLPGKLTGTTWQIDAKGVNTGTNSFVVVECRRFTKNQRQTQAKLGELAFVISDVGANGGVMVSPYHLQSGAELVAKATGIQHIILGPDSTVESFYINFVDKLKIVRGAPLFISGS